MSAIHELIQSGSCIRRLRELLVGGKDPNGQDGEGRTPLHIAVMKCGRDPQVLKETLLVVRELINHGAEVNLGDNTGCSPLHLAVMCRDLEMIETLLQVNADINKQDERGWTPLHYAAIQSSFCRMDGDSSCSPEPRVVNLLLRYRPDQNIRNQNNDTPLMLAVRCNQMRIIRALLNENSSPNLQDSEGNSIMHYALDVSQVNVDVVLELARQGCSFNVPNNSDKTPRGSYFEKLRLNHPLAEVEKAKPILKTVLLDKHNFSDDEENCLRIISEESKSDELAIYLHNCYHEIIKMRKPKLAPKYWVFNIAMRGAFSGNFKNEDPISLEVFNKVLDELIEGEFPVYCDVIAAGICKRYMNEKFADKCCSAQTGIEFLYFDVLKLVSFYLSQYEMVNMMIACSMN